MLTPQQWSQSVLVLFVFVCTVLFLAYTITEHVRNSSGTRCRQMSHAALAGVAVVVVIVLWLLLDKSFRSP